MRNTVKYYLCIFVTFLVPMLLAAAIGIRFQFSCGYVILLAAIAGIGIGFPADRMIDNHWRETVPIRGDPRGQAREN